MRPDPAVMSRDLARVTRPDPVVVVELTDET
jgi:hypothetical protein